MKIVSFFWWIDICSNLFFYPENQHDTAPKINRIVASQKLYYFGTFKSIMLLYPLCYNNWLKISYLTFCFCAISGWFSGLEKKFEQISIHQKNETIFILFLLAFRDFFSVCWWSGLYNYLVEGFEEETKKPSETQIFCAL